MLRYEFVTKAYPSILKKGSVYMTLPGQFDQNFNNCLTRWEAMQKELNKPKMRTFDQTSKGKKLKDKGGGSKDTGLLGRSSTLAGGMFG